MCLVVVGKPFLVFLVSGGIYALMKYSMHSGTRRAARKWELSSIKCRYTPVGFMRTIVQIWQYYHSSIGMAISFRSTFVVVIHRSVYVNIKVF